MAPLDRSSKDTLVRLGSGMAVERDVLHVTEKVKQYDSNLSIQFTQEGNLGEAPYRLVERCPDGITRVVFEIWELDDRVLERLESADTARYNVLTTLDQHNNVVRKDQSRRYQEKRDSAIDIVTSFLKSPKGRWSFKDEHSKEPEKKIILDDSARH